MEIMEGFEGLGLLMMWMGANDMMMRWIEKEKVIDGDKYRMLIKSWKPMLLNRVAPDEFHDFVVVTYVLSKSARSTMNLNSYQRVNKLSNWPSRNFTGQMTVNSIPFFISLKFTLYFFKFSSFAHQVPFQSSVFVN